MPTLRDRMRVSLVALTLVAIPGACADQPAGPEADEASPEAVESVSAAGALDVAADRAPRHLVTYRGRSPRGLASSVERAGGSIVAAYDEYGFAIISGIGEEALDDISGLRGVDFAGREPLIELGRPDLAPRSLTTSAVSSPSNPAAALGFFLQWHLRAVGAPDAWASGRLGSSDVTLAILDTGIDVSLPDMAGRVDLSRSAAFHDRDDALASIHYPDNPAYQDFNFHGTHVASIAASNSVIFAGTSTGTTLMAVKVCDWQGLCPLGAIFEGIIHSIENGADVINMSLGGGFDKAGSGGFVSVINRLFNGAKRAGVTVVVAAGNDAADLDHNGSFFASYCDAPHVICVAASAPASATDVIADGPWPGTMVPSSFTNFGRSSITVAAPGGDFDLPGEEDLSDNRFVDGPCSTTSIFVLLFLNFQCTPGSVLGVIGTSQAAPHVAGLAALLAEDYGRSPARIKAAIEKGADDLGQPGTDPFFGKGYINVPATLGIE